jgi:hypothetical protein
MKANKNFDGKVNLRRLQAPVERLIEAINSNLASGETLCAKTLSFLGIFILRDFFHYQFAVELLGLYEGTSKKKEVEFHPTRVELSDNLFIEKLMAYEKLKKLLCGGSFFGGNVAVNKPFVFRKDQKNVDRVHLHNDIDYMIGTHERYSLFIALTEAKKSNGGLIVFPGTHHFGSLGDAGEINEEILPENYPQIATHMFPGDLMIMNSAIWHKSEKNLDETPRIYLEIKIQDANDPTSDYIACGKRHSEFSNLLGVDEIFKSSRVTKLKKFYSP